MQKLSVSIQQETVNAQSLGQKITSHNLSDTRLKRNEVRWIIKESSKILKQQPTVLQLSGPLKKITKGSVCGHYKELVQIFQHCGQPSYQNYLFLGNYVAKGPNSIEVILTLLWYKIQYPENFFLLRGRFQTIENNYIFGFFEECKAKYDEEIWNEFNDLFTYFPLASLIDKKIYCVSSGLSHSIKTIQQMKNITRNQEMTQISELVQILESKPILKQMKQKNIKNHQQFNDQTLRAWINNNKLSLVIRSNSILEHGLQFSFQCQLLTLWSISNFMNMNNLGAVLSIDEGLQCSFEVIKAKK